MDFHSPSVEQIAEFLLHLFQDRKLQPSTIDGYRSAIADKIGNSTVSISKNENLNRLLDSFHMDRPKGRRGVPARNLSLVLHQLTKAPFEPLRKASLKHLTFKMVFLLALGSGKAGAKFMPGSTGTSVISRIGPRFHFAPLQVFCQRTNLHGRVRRVSLQWTFRPWH